MKRHLLQFTAVLFLGLAVLTIEGSGQKQKPRPKPIVSNLIIRAEKPLPPDKQRRLASFDKVWDTINLFYYDKAFGGLNWSRMYTDFKPRVLAAKSDIEFHRILEEMIGRLGRSHLAIIPPEYYQTLNEAKRESRSREAAAGRGGTPAGEEGGEEQDDELVPPSTRFGIGVEIRIIDGKVVITKVEEQSGAALVGLRKGFVIESINGVSMREMIDRITLFNPSRRVVTQYLPMQISALFLNGDADTSVLLTCLDEEDKAADYKVPRFSLNGRAVSLGPNYPEQFLQFEASSLSDDVGYIRFNVFGVPVIERFCDAIGEFKSKKAVIVDLRGNIGGIIGTIVGLMGMVTDKELPIGTSIYRHGEERLAARALGRNFKGKVVVLIDGQSMSSAEMFAAALKEGSRAVLIGEKTAGEALPAGSVRLETGAVLIYPVANFLTPKGRALEGTGLEPHISVPLTRASVFGGADPQLARALAVVKDESAFGRLLAAVPQAAAISTGGSGSGTGTGPGSPVPPPPPPPIAKPRPGDPAPKEMKLTRISTVASPGSPAAGKDQDSLATIKAFAAKLSANGKDISSYEASGFATVGRDGSQGTVDLAAWRERPGRFAIAITSDAAGEVRTIYNGKTMTTQTAYGLDRETAIATDLERVELFAPLFMAADPERFRSLKFEGIHDLEGRRVKVISGVTTDGFTAGMSFDAETNVLLTLALPGMMFTLGDYRPVNGIMVPFDLKMEPVMHVKLTHVKLNEKIEASHFEKKERCFDKTN
jgi:carboxyl-terminal processing protease